VSESDLLPWATYEHPAADSYGRQVLTFTLTLSLTLA